MAHYLRTTSGLLAGSYVAEVGPVLTMPRCCPRGRGSLRGSTIYMVAGFVFRGFTSSSGTANVAQDAEEDKRAVEDKPAPPPPPCTGGAGGRWAGWRVRLAWIVLILLGQCAGTLLFVVVL